MSHQGALERVAFSLLSNIVAFSCIRLIDQGETQTIGVRTEAGYCSVQNPESEIACLFIARDQLDSAFYMARQVCALTYVVQQSSSVHTVECLQQFRKGRLSICCSSERHSNARCMFSFLWVSHGTVLASVDILN
jgi:hypothetical protein